MVSIHNYGARHRYGPQDPGSGADPERTPGHPGGADHWSSDDPVDDDRPVRGPAGPDESGGRRKKFFPGTPGRRKSE